MPPKKNRARRFLLGSALLVFLFAGATAFLAFRLRHQTRQKTQALVTHEAEGKPIETAVVEQSNPERTLLLMGETRAFFSVTLYARVSGYMDELYADIGDSVRTGQILAHVESPETEQAYNSARASAINLKHIALRNKLLLKRKLISAQEAEQAFANAEVAQANVGTEAVLRSYQNVVAPFDGIISNRFVDPGTLLQNASGSQAASQPLFTLTKADPLRVFMYVDQKDAPFVKMGDEVEILVPSQTLAQTSLKARVSKIAAELDPRTRTLLVEVILPNHDHQVVAGGFVQARMTIQVPSYFVLPSQALTMRQNKPFVPLVDQDQRLHFATVDLIENSGEKIFIRSGLEKGERVALNVGNSLREGQKVRILEKKGQNQEGQKQMAGQAAVGEPSK